MLITRYRTGFRYNALIAGFTEIGETRDPEELKYAEWVQREDTVLQPGEFSLTNEMMKMFKEAELQGWKNNIFDAKRGWKNNILRV